MSEVQKRGLRMEFSPEDQELAAATLHQMALEHRARVSIDRGAPVVMLACTATQLLVAPLVEGVDGEPVYGHGRPVQLADISELYVY